MKKSIKRKIPCDHCGKIFYIFPSQINTTHNFCSRKCADERKHKRADRICKYCGKTFTTHLCYLKRGQMKFCSIKCRSNSMITYRSCLFCHKNFKLQGKNSKAKFCSHNCFNHYRRSRNNIECHYCKKIFHTTPHKLKQYKFLYCSNVCRLKDDFHLVKEPLMIELLNKILKYPFYKRQATFKWLKNPKTKCTLYLDIYFPIFKLAFEYDGIYHFKETFLRNSNVKERDELKNKLCKKHGIKLIRINYKEPLTEKYLTRKLK